MKKKEKKEHESNNDSVKIQMMITYPCLRIISMILFWLHRFCVKDLVWIGTFVA